MTGGPAFVPEDIDEKDGGERTQSVVVGPKLEGFFVHNTTSLVVVDVDHVAVDGIGG